MMARFESERNEYQDVTVYRAHGAITLEDIIHQMTDFYAEGCTLHLVWDLRKATVINATSDKMRDLITHVKGLGAMRRGGRTAIVVQNSLTYSLGRMYKTLTDVLEYEVEHQVFRALDEALKWVADGEKG